MMLMCGQSNQMWHWAAGAYPGRAGMILGPVNLRKQALRPWMPFALDNDAFSAWTNKTQWDEDAYWDMVKRVRLTRLRPLWALVPDVVADKDATIDKWQRFEPMLRKLGWDLAFACQDGMTPSDVPPGADIIFIGGTTTWKWKTLPMWSKHFKRVHVGRVNELRRLWTCEDYGVESVDGTGWFRDTQDGRRLRALMMWLDGHRRESGELFPNQVGLAGAMR